MAVILALMRPKAADRASLDSEGAEFSFECRECVRQVGCRLQKIAAVSLGLRHAAEAHPAFAVKAHQLQLLTSQIGK